jgi:menaquinol-cytochrome c reductase iron-sulfur subunit
MTEQASSNPEEMGRRKFLTGIIGVVAGSVAAVVGLPAIGYIVSPGVKLQNREQWLTLGPISSLTLGVPTAFPYSRRIQDGWVESTQSGVAYALTYDGQNVLVLSDVCTHLSCRVTWHVDRGEYICPCHDGLFDIEGTVTAGPPPRPLDPFQSKVENGQIMILLEA